MTRRSVGAPRITLPRPKATTNIITAMPRPTPRRHPRPRRTPTCAPVAISKTLLGPGVPAAATEKRKNATAWSRVMWATSRMSDRLDHGADGREIGRGGSCTFVRGRRLDGRVPAGRGRRAAARVVRRPRLRAASPRHVCHQRHRGGRPDADYRGRVEQSLPGEVVVLHPDEMHDGRPGTAAGFGYREVYVDPGRIADAVRVITGGVSPLRSSGDPSPTARPWLARSRPPSELRSSPWRSIPWFSGLPRASSMRRRTGPWPARPSVSTGRRSARPGDT